MCVSQCQGSWGKSQKWPATQLAIVPNHTESNNGCLPPAPPLPPLPRCINIQDLQFTPPTSPPQRAHTLLCTWQIFILIGRSSPALYYLCYIIISIVIFISFYWLKLILVFQSCRYVPYLPRPERKKEICQEDFCINDITYKDCLLYKSSLYTSCWFLSLIWAYYI